MDFATGLGLLLTAGALGLTHGVEPDHVAGIVTLTHEAKEPKLSAIVGAWFAIGHVVLVVAWMFVVYQLRGLSSIPRSFEQFGMLFVGIVLSLLSFYLGFTGVRKLVHRHTHSHGGETHSHFHVHLPFAMSFFGAAWENRDGHAHDHTMLEYLKIGVVGAAFTLSPPISMIAFISVVMTQADVPLLTGSILMYAGTIVATMAVLGGGAGTLSRFLETRGRRVHAVSQIVASALVFAFAVKILADIIPGLLA